MRTIKLENRVLLVTESNIIVLTTEQYIDLINAIKNVKKSKNSIDSLHLSFINWEVTQGVEPNTQQYFDQLLDKVISDPNFTDNDLETNYDEDEDLAEFNSSVQQVTDMDYTQVIYIEKDNVQFLSDDPDDDDNYSTLNIKLSEFDTSEAETMLDVFNELEAKLFLYGLYVEGDEVDQALKKLETRIKKGK